MLSLLNTNKLSSTESVDIIEKIVYDDLKQLGFRKHGRTLHRFVDGDISQVIHFQNDYPQVGFNNSHKDSDNILWINLGIRVPESFEKAFTITEPIKKYYHEYECNIRSRLGSLVDGEDTYYKLNSDPERIGCDALYRIKKYVIPIFDVLNSREAILTHRRDYPEIDELQSNLILLEEAMIYGRWGDTQKATALFNEYYSNVLNEYYYTLRHGSKEYFRKGEIVTYYNVRTCEIETIRASKNGYLTLYNANRRHLDYLEELADKIGINIEK